MPVATPVTTPDVPISAAAVLLLVQVPPGVGSPSEITSRAQIVLTPFIGEGNGSTVSVVVVLQPVTNV